MNTGRVAFAHRFASAVLLLLLLILVFLLAWEWSRFKIQGTSGTRDAQTTVVARSNRAEPVISNAPAALVEVASPTNRPAANPPQNVGAPESPVSARAPTARKLTISRGRNEQTVKLADGRELTSAGLTYGV